MILPFHQVDAFADRPFGGNPAAVMPLDRWLDDATLQAIAAENNLAETAFLVPHEGDDADYDLRWFTPAVEVALCGHATLAAGHALLSAMTEPARLRFSTRKAGILVVARDGEGYAMRLPAWAPTPKPLPEVVAALGVAAIETLWHAQRYAVVRVADRAAVEACIPDFQRLAALGDLLTIVTALDGTVGIDVVSRAFAPGAGIDEDPVTGSAHAVIAPYWAGLLGRDRFTAWQASARGGGMSCTMDGDGVILGGRCVTVIEGRFRV